MPSSCYRAQILEAETIIMVWEHQRERERGLGGVCAYVCVGGVLGGGGGVDKLSWDEVISFRFSPSRDPSCLIELSKVLVTPW